MALIRSNTSAVGYGPWVADGKRSGQNLLKVQIRIVLLIVDRGTRGKVAEEAEGLFLVLTRAGERFRVPLSDEFAEIWKDKAPEGLVSRHAEVCAAGLAFRRERVARELEEGDAEDWRDLVRGFLITPPVLRGLLARGFSIPPGPFILIRFASRVAGALATLVVGMLWFDLASLLWLLLGLTVVVALVLKLQPKGLKFLDPAGRACRVEDFTDNGRYRLTIRRSPYPETVEFDTSGIPLAEIPAWLDGRLDRGLAGTIQG